MLQRPAMISMTVSGGFQGLTQELLMKQNFISRPLQSMFRYVPDRNESKAVSSRQLLYLLKYVWFCT